MSGIFVAADPAQGIELEEAVGYVGEESREFEGANIERDSHLPQLLLQHRRHQARAFFGGRLHGEMKANAVHLRISRLLEQLAGAGGIVVIGRHVAVVSPALRGQNAVGGPGKTALQIFEQRAAVNGIREGLPNSLVLENGIAQIECQIRQDGAGSVQDGEIGVAFQGQDHVGGQGVDGDVGAAFAQFQSARGGVGHDNKTDFGEMCFLSPVVVIAGEHNIFVLLRADETERAGADGLAADLVAAAIGHDAHGAVGEIPQQRSERLFEVEDDGVVVGGVDVVHEPVNR